jgi:hypothetical protein
LRDVPRHEDAMDAGMLAGNLLQGSTPSIDPSRDRSRRCRTLRRGRGSALWRPPGAGVDDVVPELAKSRCSDLQIVSDSPTTSTPRCKLRERRAV